MLFLYPRGIEKYALSYHRMQKRNNYLAGLEADSINYTKHMNVLTYKLELEGGIHNSNMEAQSFSVEKSVL